MLPRIALWRSFIPLLHGDSAAVFTILVFSFSPISQKSSFANSLPLSESIRYGDPKMATHIDKTPDIITSLLFDGMASSSSSLIYLKSIEQNNNNCHKSYNSKNKITIISNNI